MSNTAETPLLDLLKSVPADARMIYEHSPTHSSNIPFGVLAKRAADALTTQAAELEAMRERLDFHVAFTREAQDLGMAAQKQVAEQAAQLEALRGDAERLDWCLERLFNTDSGWLTTDTGCGCCGEGLSFEGMTGRAAIDAALAGKAVTP